MEIMIKPGYLFLLFLTGLGWFKTTAQPYSGTIFISSSTNPSKDASTLISTTYTGRGMRTIFNRRIPDWVTVNAFLFDVVWNDGLKSEAQFNPEFGSVSAAPFEAEKYAREIGRLFGQFQPIPKRDLPVKPEF